MNEGKTGSAWINFHVSWIVYSWNLNLLDSKYSLLAHVVDTLSAMIENEQPTHEPRQRKSAFTKSTFTVVLLNLVEEFIMPLKSTLIVYICKFDVKSPQRMLPCAFIFFAMEINSPLVHLDVQIFIKLLDLITTTVRPCCSWTGGVNPLITNCRSLLRFL